MHSGVKMRKYILLILLCIIGCNKGEPVIIEDCSQYLNYSNYWCELGNITCALEKQDLWNKDYANYVTCSEKNLRGKT